MKISMKTIHLIVGTRPEIIKIVPLFKVLKDALDQKKILNLQVKLISTGQHRELLQQTLAAFNFEPDLNLEIMRPNQSLSELTANLLIGLEKHFQQERPNCVLALGDTTTCYTTALSCFYHQIPFFHVEAGLRTFHLDSPFPEEFNRQCIAQLATHHFAPTEQAKQNLLHEGVRPESISVVGSTFTDAIKLVNLDRGRDKIDNHIQKKTVLFTLHRREKDSSTIKGVMAAIQQAACEHPETIFIFPVHPNPAIQDLAHSIFSSAENVMLTEPIPYPHFLSLLSQSSLVVTDSGGVQEEAAYFGRPTLILRDQTERSDGLHQQTTQVIGTDPKKIITSITNQLCNKNVEMEVDSASERIADIILKRCFK